MPSTTGSRGWGARIALGSLWLVTILEVLAMGLAGSMKFTRPGMWTAYFVQFGFAAWFSYVIGAAEMAGAALLLVPRVAAWAAVLLLAIMIVALVEVATHDTDLGADGPTVHVVLLTVILAARWGARWRPGGSER